MYLDEIHIDMIPTKDNYVRTFEMQGTVARTVYHQLVVSNVGTTVRWDLRFFMSISILYSDVLYKVISGETVEFIDHDGGSHQVKVLNWREMGSYVQDGEFFPFLTEISATLELVYPISMP